MVILYFAVMAPIGLTLRLFGSDPLRLKTVPARSSYWLPRDTPGERQTITIKQY